METDKQQEKPRGEYSGGQPPLAHLYSMLPVCSLRPRWPFHANYEI